MKIGVFDSGLGGLIITKSFIGELGQYDYVYYGDTLNLPYGDKSSQDVLSYSIDAVKYLISQDCKLIIIACNTASSIALRYIQQVFIPEYSPATKVLGVIVPTVEEAVALGGNVGVIATQATVVSHIYKIELEKINKNIKVFELAAKDLVPAIEANSLQDVDRLIFEYSQQFPEVESLILGCTHYPIAKEYFRCHFPSSVNIISQDEFMPRKLKSYLANHPEIEKKLTKNSDHKFLVSDLRDNYINVAHQIISNIVIEQA